MAKVIKLKQSDIEKIVEGVLKEQQENITQTEDTPINELDGGVELSLGQDEEGNFYVMKNGSSDQPEVIAKTK